MLQDLFKKKIDPSMSIHLMLVTLARKQGISPKDLVKGILYEEDKNLEYMLAISDAMAEQLKIAKLVREQKRNDN